MRINPISPDIRHQKRKRIRDAAFLNWLSYQPSCIDGAWNQMDDGHGKPRNIACHVRRISRGAGMGIKPEFSAISLTQAQHDVQTLYGEAACLDAFHPTKMDWKHAEAQEFFEKQADLAVRRFTAHSPSKSAE